MIKTNLEGGAKQQQFVSGVDSYGFWSGNMNESKGPSRRWGWSSPLSQRRDEGAANNHMQTAPFLSESGQSSVTTGQRVRYRPSSLASAGLSAWGKDCTLQTILQPVFTRSNSVPSRGVGMWELRRVSSWERGAAEGLKGTWKTRSEMSMESDPQDRCCILSHLTVLHRLGFCTSEPGPLLLPLL